MPCHTTYCAGCQNTYDCQIHVWCMSVCQWHIPSSALAAMIICTARLVVPGCSQITSHATSLECGWRTCSSGFCCCAQLANNACQQPVQYMMCKLYNTIVVDSDLRSAAASICHGKWFCAGSVFIADQWMSEGIHRVLSIQNLEANYCIIITV